jgi:hypothetical protein
MSFYLIFIIGVNLTVGVDYPTTKGKVYSEEEDQYLLCRLNFYRMTANISPHNTRGPQARSLSSFQRYVTTGVVQE